MSGWSFISHSPDETERFGEQLGLLLRPGSFLALRGGLGGGKTCFTRGVVASLVPGSAHMVASPTFAIMNSYQGDVPVYHFDFYRLCGDDDIVELGFEDFFYGAGVCIVEWSERINQLMPADHIVITFDFLDEQRRGIDIAATGPESENIISCLAEI